VWSATNVKEKGAGGHISMLAVPPRLFFLAEVSVFTLINRPFVPVSINLKRTRALFVSLDIRVF